MKATYLKTLDHTPKRHQALYRLDPPMGENALVVVSAVCDYFFETYIFPANEAGEVTSWGELAGSTKNTFDHHVALANAGYEL